MISSISNSILPYLLLMAKMVSTAETITFYDGSDNDMCSLFLAPSTVPGAGYGIFTTKDVAPGTEFFGENIAVPLIDLSLYDVTHSLIFTDYYWAGSSEHQKYEALELDMIELSPLGTLSNHHSKLHNLALVPGTHDDTMVNRLLDNEAGAFTYHGGERYCAKHAISAGSELFNNYGNDWWEDRVTRFKLTLATGTNGDEQQQSIADSQGETCAAAAVGSAEAQQSIDEGMCPVEWIKMHGVCVDNIKLGKTSTITDNKAGRGAFAKRFLKAESLIAPIPLLHVIDKDVFNFYLWDTPNNDGARVLLKEQGVIGKQLLLNYCFGHPQSSLLLCQTTNTALINHNKDQPNARIQWSEWDPSTRSWLSLSFDEVSKKKGRGLVFDLIATRDINEGEEIFIDYGDEWQASWDMHKETWTPPTSNQFASYAQTDLLNMEDRTTTIRTKKELVSNPYPSNIMTVCIYTYDDDNGEKSDENSTGEVKVDIIGTDEELIELYSESGSHYVSDYPPGHEEYHPCIVYSRQPQYETFTVRIFKDFYDLDSEADDTGTPIILTDYPEISIKFVNRPYMADSFLPQAFRHSIGIPDNIFPSQWKNQK